jgi:hypothetical protein
MFSVYYAAMLSMWTTLARFASAGRLADGSAMPLGLKTEILVRAPIVNALVTRGRTLDASDIAGNAQVVEQLVQQQVALHDLLDRFGLLSVLSFVTTPPITAGRNIGAMIRDADPELANVINRNLPNIGNPFVTGGIGLVAGIALVIAGLIAIKMK